MRGDESNELWQSTFQQAVCEAFSILPEAYVLTVFWRGLYWHAKPMAFVIHKLWPDYFREDFSVIEELADVRDPKIFTAELNYFFGRNRRDKRWLRTALGIRVSAKRLIRLKNRVLANRA
jgi:hypothetical protein